MLVNPTGRPGKFRAPDWVEEKGNLDTKVVLCPLGIRRVADDFISFQFTFGGNDANYTKERVIKESTLIHIYRSCQENMERNLGLPSPNASHVEADLTKTLEVLQSHLRQHEPNAHRPGRRSTYSIPNMIDRGQNLILQASLGTCNDTEEDEDNENGRAGPAEAEDIGVVDL